jgi:hypothetical protein
MRSNLSVPEQHSVIVLDSTNGTKEHPIVHDWWTCGCATCQQRAKAAVASVIQPVVQWMAK